MRKITIRSSSLGAYVSCPKQWYETYVLGKTTIPNARALVGTSIHSGAEVMWNEAIRTGKKDPNITMMTDAAVQSYDTKVKEAEGQLVYDEDVNDNFYRDTIVKGTKAFVSDIVPFTKIPLAVEKKLSVDIQHPMVEAITGTLDYLGTETIADIKTSKRKVVAQSYKLQQSMYKHLAQINGYDVKRNFIQGIVLAKTKVAGGIDELTTNVAQAKFITNNLLDKLEAVYSGVDPDILFQGNPKHYLCSAKYCSLYSKCSFINGEKNNMEKIDKAKINDEMYNIKIYPKAKKHVHITISLRVEEDFANDWRKYKKKINTSKTIVPFIQKVIEKCKTH